MKSKKILLSMLMLVVAIVLMFSTESFADTKTLSVGRAGTQTAYLREGDRIFYNPTSGVFSNKKAKEYTYVMTSLVGNYKGGSVPTNFPVYKIVENSGSTVSYENAIYCLKAGLGFMLPSSDSSVYSNVLYTLKGDFANSEIYNYFNGTFNTTSTKLSESNYKSLLWLLDNLYLPKQIEAEAEENYTTEQLKINYKAIQRQEYFDKIFSYSDNNLSALTRNDTQFYLLTDDDIEVAQQWAIWYFTNNEDTMFNNLPTVNVSSDGNITSTNNLKDLASYGEDMSQYGYNNLANNNDGGARQTQMQTLYSYLVANAKANSNYSKLSLSLNSDDAKTQSDVLNQRYKIGPIKITKEGSNVTNSDVKLVITDLNNNTIASSNYSLYNDSQLSTLEAIINNGDDLYIYINKSSLNTKGIKIKLTYNSGRNVTLWESGSANQPVVIVEDNDIDLNTQITIEEFDLALRKYITDVTRNGVSIKNNISQMTTRTPSIITTALASGNDTTATYNHRKDAVPVQTGDIVTYNITIYNEGDLAGRATKITDLLPEGLEFYQAVSTDYDFSVSGQIITITPKSTNTANLAAYTSGTPASKTITFLCRVTKRAESGKSEILTNVAQIAEAIDEKSVVYTKTDSLTRSDRDSTPNNLPRIANADLPSYRGNTNNNTDLSNSAYFYKGQEDDDDFEKVIVTTPSFDLALRKYIVGLERPTINDNGTTELVTITPTQVNELNGRTPSIDVSPLKNSGTTATYTHSKTPVPVKTGDIVTYRITIYNEGDISGRATEVTDYLPDGLEFYSIDSASKYTAEEKVENGVRKIIFTAKSTLGNLDAFDTKTGTALASETIEFKCKVVGTTAPGTSVGLRNIAEITEAKDYENNLKMEEGDDRDSEPNNVDIPNYNNASQQDDDDFELLRLSTPKFDLSLRKFITAITTEDGTERTIESREPEVNTAPLTNTTKVDTTALYKHTKDILVVKPGDIITFTIRVYNEGEADGFVTEIEDFYEDGLALASTSLNTQYGWTTPTINDQGKQSTTTDYLKTTVLRHFEKGKDLDYADVQIQCVVTNAAQPGHKLTNIAQINAYVNLENTGDIDSQINNFEIPAGGLEPYDGTGILTDADFDEGNEQGEVIISNYDKYYKGQQDDDDFEKIEIYTPGFDLALKKYITGVIHEDGIAETINNREPSVNTSSLAYGYNATYTFANKNENGVKVPVKVEIGDTVRYAIRVYNEGEISGYATEIEDYLPLELEFVDSQFNQDRGWHVVENKTYGTNRTGTIVATDALKDELILAYDGGDTLDSKYIEIECKVKEIGNINGKILTNIAQITKAEDEEHNEIKNPGDDRDSEPDNANIPTDSSLPGYSLNQQDDDDYEKIYVPAFDLSLVKFITQIKHQDGTINNIDRQLSVDVTPLKNGKETANYTLTKTPITVRVGDIVVYTIRVYNEGETKGYVTLIEDYIPANLEIISQQDSDINKKYDWDIKSNGRIATTEYWNKAQADARTSDKNYIINPFDTETSTELDYRDVQIECRVKASAEAGEILTNIAQINGDSGDDRDSTPTNAPKPDGDDLAKYPEGYPIPKADNSEDDYDYEKVRLYQPQYDLALRKFITKVEDNDITDRIPVVDVSPLKDNDDNTTTAIYTHTKTPLLVKHGDIVVYTIRVYNEGEIDAYAEEIKDNIPEGLEYIIDNEINVEYRWKLSQDRKTVSSDYLSKDRDENNVIKAFDSSKMTTLNYKDVKIAFKVTEPNTSTKIITNIAEIKDEDGNDIDSTPNNDKPGEDDIDEEKIRLKYFDLALRKYISKVESKTGENLPIETDTTTNESREPQVEIDSNGNIKYIHPKAPVIVANSDIVIYTLRIYNEGTVDGFAEEVKDNIPDGLQLEKNHAINVKYGWVMYDEDGNVTDDVTKAKTIRTTYLSEQNSEDNVIPAFDRTTMSEPAYKEVQVAFKVVEKNVGEERIIINIAEISKDNDEDIDSTPDNDKENEDDIDKEYIKLKYFDLSLLKWVSKVMLTENGKTTVKVTGYNGLENPEPLVKTELTPSQVKSAVLKYEYGIKIANEGQIAGYAKEVADYIPDGLEFIPADNPLWTLKENGKIVTTQLENTLLQPGESAIITVVFKWKNGDNNFGTKVNWAEISKDYNDKDAEDIDSTPDNNQRNPKEDDIDYAQVVLNPKTGTTALYITLTLVVLTIISGGVVLIKKYVL